jgi:hypothetical protein
MKHVRPDHTFVYYYQQRPDGRHVGIRVGRTHAWVIEGDSGNPELLEVWGRAHRIPLDDQVASEQFLNVRGPIVDEHPELDRVLRGEVRLEDLVE